MWSAEYEVIIMDQPTLLSATSSLLNTAKKQYRKLKQIFLENEFRRHSPNFHIHVSVSDLIIPTINLPILLQEKFLTNPGNI